MKLSVLVSLMSVVLVLFSGNSVFAQECPPDNCSFNPVCEAAEELAWDSANSEEDQVAGSPRTVAINGGVGPYTWEIAGSGFSFAANSLQQLTSPATSVVINTQNDCCAATITVKDSCCQKTAGYLRCSDNGQWNLVQSVFGANNFPAWDSVVVPIKLDPPINYSTLYKTFRQKTDIISGRYALLWGSGRGAPDNTPRSVKYSSGLQPHTCSVGAYNGVMSSDGIVNAFNIPISIDYVHTFSTHPRCGGGPLDIGFFLYDSVSIKEWRCN